MQLDDKDDDRAVANRETWGSSSSRTQSPPSDSIETALPIADANKRVSDLESVSQPKEPGGIGPQDDVSSLLEQARDSARGKDILDLINFAQVISLPFHYINSTLFLLPF